LAARRQPIMTATEGPKGDRWTDLPSSKPEHDPDGGAIDDPEAGAPEPGPASDEEPGPDPGNDPRRRPPDGPPPEMADVVEGPIGSARLKGPELAGD
jgi:hypothetical protein